MSHRNFLVASVTCLAFVISILLAGPGSPIPAATGTSGYHIIKTIPLGGTEGWDYLTTDSAARILYISRENHIDAVNIDTGAVVGKVTGLGGTNGLLPVPELGRGFVTNEGYKRGLHCRSQNAAKNRDGQNRQSARFVCLRSGYQACLHHEQRGSQRDRD